MECLDHSSTPNQPKHFERHYTRYSSLHWHAKHYTFAVQKSRKHVIRRTSKYAVNFKVHGNCKMWRSRSSPTVPLFMISHAFCFMQRGFSMGNDVYCDADVWSFQLVSFGNSSKESMAAFSVDGGLCIKHSNWKMTPKFLVLNIYDKSKVGSQFDNQIS